MCVLRSGAAEGGPPRFVGSAADADADAAADDANAADAREEERSAAPLSAISHTRLSAHLAPTRPYTLSLVDPIAIERSLPLNQKFRDDDKKQCSLTSPTPSS